MNNMCLCLTLPLKNASGHHCPAAITAMPTSSILNNCIIKMTLLGLIVHKKLGKGIDYTLSSTHDLGNEIECCFVDLWWLLNTEQ
jgi:hypothetical protein